MDSSPRNDPPLSAASVSSGASPDASNDAIGSATNFSSTSSATSEGRSSQAPPASLAVPAACLGCRSKHVKCDGNNPCSRCAGASMECVYVASRRGYKGPRKKKRLASSSPPDSTELPESCPMMLGAPPVSNPATSSVGFIPAVIADGQPDTPFQATPALSEVQLYRLGGGMEPGNLVVAPTPTPAPAVPPVAANERQPALPERCFDSFYHNFFAAHPFVLPKAFFLRLLKEGSVNLEPVLAAMRYVGSLYIDVGPARAIYLDEALRLVYLVSTAKDGFLVQALLILIVGLDGSCQMDKARQLLGDAERIAIEIGLNTRQFATLHGRGNPVLEESWRRTWWDLWVCDGMVAGVHRVTNFLLFDYLADVALPCEEAEYLSGNIPQQPLYLEDFDDQLFSGEEREFSSFAYRISAARNLGRFMRVPNMMYPDDENVSKIETLLTNWRMHLPPNKRHALNKNYQLDEMIFQGYMINHACTIMLHQPLSQLDTSPTRAVTSCAPHRPNPSGDVFNAHTRHTFSAASEVSKMITAAGAPITAHTHFFTCVITLSSVVHLSKWAQLFFLHDDAEDDLRQQIRLNIGALGRLSSVWKAAGTAAGQVTGTARDIYRAKKAQQISPAYWVGFTQQEMIESLNADEGIMSEFNNMNMLAAVTQGPGPQ